MTLTNGHEPQMSFDEELLNIETEADLYDCLDSLDKTRVQFSQHGKARRELKKHMERLNMLDGHPHAVRCGEFVITVSPGEGAAKDISFRRLPPTTLKVKRQEKN